MCARLCVCASRFVCVHVRVGACFCVFLGLCVYMYVCARAFVRVLLGLCVYMYVCVRACVCLLVCVCACVCCWRLGGGVERRGVDRQYMPGPPSEQQHPAPRFTGVAGLITDRAATGRHAHTVSPPSSSSLPHPAFSLCHSVTLSPRPALSTFPVSLSVPPVTPLPVSPSLPSLSPLSPSP